MDFKAKFNSLNQEDFLFKSGAVGGEQSVLVYPKAFPKWNDNNKFFRSSLWRVRDFKPLSLGFRKFTNLNEQPDFEPINFNKPISYLRKIDGSLAIISKTNGEICFRTRGTLTARQLENGYEIDLLLQKYPKLFDNELINSEQFTILCEWTSPANIIIINESSEPDLWLLGVVNHCDYSYFTQHKVDELSKEWGIKRPKRYDFTDINECVKKTSNLTDSEGIVIYANNDQILKKAKGELYLKLHRFKSEATLENVVDLFAEYGYPSYHDFERFIVERFDYECFTYVRGFVSRICDVYKEVQRIIEGFNRCVEEIKNLETRKEQAQLIKSKYSTTNRASFVFSLLDGKELSKDNIKKLIFQCLKK